VASAARRALAVPKRAWLAAGGAVVVGAIALVFAFGPIVRARIAKEGARRRLDVTVGSVHPGFFAVSLGDVRVKPEGIPGVEVRLDRVRVELSAALGVRDVVAQGGTIDVDGEPEDLADRLKQLRKSSADTGSNERSSKTPLSVSDLAVAWKMPSGGRVTASGLSAKRDDQGVHVLCAKLSAAYREESVELTGGELDVALDGTPRRVAAASLTIAEERANPAPNASTPQPAGGAADPAPPPLPPPTGKAARAEAKAKAKARAKADKAKAKLASAAASGPASDEPVLPLPDLHAARRRIGALTRLLGERIPDGSKIDIAGLAARLDVGGEPVAFGPGPFTLERRGDRVHLTFTSDKGAGENKDGTPLAIDAELPLGAGDVVARLSGGPVSLALLGVKEGTKGLEDVTHGAVSGRGQLVLSAAGDALTFDGEVALRSITLDQPRLSGEKLRRIDFSLGARGVLDDTGKLRVDDAQLDMGAFHLKTHGTIEETKDHFGLSLGVDVAPAACQALVESAPEGLLPTVRQARMTGTFGATARVVFDTRTIDKLVLDYTIDDRCRMSEVPPELSRDRFSGSFTYRTYHPDGTTGETTTGPGTPDWTDLAAISPYMIVAVLTTEDGAFYRHHGFNHAAIKSSVAANLKARRFVRGASTITMQLAKNVFLARDKTLSRKIEEVILTDYLEQVFRKDDMMELYLNVIEFGPDVYGITRAADYYFGRKPEELNLPECFFLASLLPSPIRYGKLRDKGQVPDTWMHHLQTLMQIAAKNGKITDAELAAGLEQPVVFVRPGDPRPEPRPPVTAVRHADDPYESDGDAAWQPLD
jgi:hypothetical protein